MATVIIGEEDARVLIKDLMRHPGFEQVQARFDIEINRLVQTMLNPNTNDTETLILKGAILKLRQFSPETLATSILKNVESKLMKQKTHGVVVQTSDLQ